MRARRDKRAETLINAVSNACGGDERLVARLEQDEQLQTTFVAAQEAAIKTSYENKRKLLARSVAEAVNDSAKVDAAQLMVERLSQLDVPHIKALQRLAQEADHVAGQQRTSTKVQWGTSDVWANEPAPIQAALLRVGAAKAPPTAYVARQDGKLVEGISDYGRQILVALHAD